MGIFVASLLTSNTADFAPVVAGANCIVSTVSLPGASIIGTTGGGTSENPSLSCVITTLSIRNVSVPVLLTVTFEYATVSQVIVGNPATVALIIGFFREVIICRIFAAACENTHDGSVVYCPVFGFGTCCATT